MRTMNRDPIKPKIIFNQSSKDFMGIKIKDGDIEIYVPDSLRIEDDEIINNRNLLLFLDSLKLTDKNEKENIESNDNDKFGALWPIESYMWIIKDFIENGFFYNREKNILMI